MIRRNVAGQVIYLPQLTTVDGVAITSAASITVAKDGVEASSAGTLTHFSSGVWKYTPTQGETDAAIVGLVLTATSGLPVVLNLITTAANTAAVALGANTTTPPTAAAIASQTRTELTTELSRIDIATSTRLASASYTTPPTAAANADATLSGLTSGPTTGGNWPNGSFGRQILIGSSPQREVAVTGSNHVAADIHELQPAVITSADFATDAISANAVSSGAVTKIVTGVWSALTSGLSVVGSTGRALARLIGLVQDSGGDEFTTKALNRAPSGTNVVTVLPASGIAAGRGETTSLVAYVGETISQSIGVYQADGTTAYDLSGKTLTIIFENLKTGDDVAVVASGSITISGASNNTVTFSYPSAATSSQRELGWVLRDEAAPKTVYLRGTLEVRYAPTVG